MRVSVISALDPFLPLRLTVSPNKFHQAAAKGRRTTFGFLHAVVLTGLSLCTALLAQEKIPRDEAKKLKNPIPYSKKSIAQGRNIFLRHCTGCHGDDGKATIDIMGAATDLTNPNVYKSGATDGEIFRSIRDGAGDTMPSFKPQLPGEQDIWYLVNYIHSLWPENMRPPLQESDKQQRH